MPNFTFLDSDKSAKIKVIGVGGAGGNAVNNMIEAGMDGVEFIVANTDSQALEKSYAEHRIQIGSNMTEGLGAGADPSVGREAALESAEEIREALAGSHMIFIAAGLGGGTGTGAAPVVAEICREMGVLTVAVVTKPFTFEGRKRMTTAEDGLEKLKYSVDTVITIPNDRIRSLAPKKASLIDMFMKADEVLLNSVKGITDLIMAPGVVNLDFADVRTTMSKAGMALMGIGVASGENRALEAAEKAISHPLLEDISVAGARGVLVNITATSAMGFDEIMEASDFILQEVGEESEIIWGTSVDESLGDEMRITVIATGIGGQGEKEPKWMGNGTTMLNQTNMVPPVVSNDLETPACLRRGHNPETKLAAGLDYTPSRTVAPVAPAAPPAPPAPPVMERPAPVAQAAPIPVAPPAPVAPVTPVVTPAAPVMPEIPKTVEAPVAKSTPVDFIPRGRVRDIGPDDFGKGEVNLIKTDKFGVVPEPPAFKESNVSEFTFSRKPDFENTDDELEIPTFLRRKAD